MRFKPIKVILQNEILSVDLFVWIASCQYPPPHIETPAAVGEWPRIQTYMYAKRS